ncbi:nuclease-related domain-containing protein [Neobacillus niacini]|uniref:nuclease-related domain-containing protein n=1 Tax=Neobacillus niacini TaxID=86668 RepID=UPI0021CB72A8|nr:nuclease-related domain-containing protein [Neobacillus niacini]MCM3764987.1 NERD domain-containing protein [Neobacillus niacini]
MFKKDILIPILLLQAEALEGRIPAIHPKMPEIKMKIRSLKSGYNGEKVINYYLKQIPAHKYYIFHDLRLPYGETFFQIDAMLLSKKILLMLDGKNHSGTLYIDKNQMTQVYNGNKEIYENPITQANRHIILLNYFLSQYQTLNIPMDSFVVITKSATEVVISPGYREAEQKICRAGDLLRVIQFAEKNFKRDVLNVDYLTELLLKNHTPKETDILKMFGINKNEVQTGVQCPRCLFMPMTFNRMNWICPICQFVSKDAFLRAIDDYFLIISSTITNRELCSFLHLPSPRAATYIFSLLNLPFSGMKNHRIYYQPQLPLNTNHHFPPTTNNIKNNFGGNLDETIIVRT